MSPSFTLESGPCLVAKTARTSTGDPELFNRLLFSSLMRTGSLPVGTEAFKERNSRLHNLNF